MNSNRRLSQNTRDLCHVSLIFLCMSCIGSNHTDKTINKTVTKFLA